MNNESVSLISTLVNLVLTALKLAAGIFTNSVALIAEAIHSGLDIISSFITYLGIRTAKKPVDEKHPYGSYQAENLAGVMVVILLIISAGWILYEGIARFFSSENAEFSIWAIILMAVTALVNEVMARLKFYYGNKFNSLALIADGEHSRADVIASVGVLIGLFLIRYYALADGIIAILIGLYILYESYGLGKEITDSLLDVRNEKLEQKISKISKENNISVSEIKSRKVGQVSFAEIKIKLDPNLTVKEADLLAKKLENELIDKIPDLKQVVVAVESHDFVQSTTVPKYGKRLSLRKNLGLGPGGECICPKCGTKVTHEKGIPCKEQKCPKCGFLMTRDSK